MKKRAVVSLANERGNYLKGLERLRASLEGRFDGDFLGFVGEESIGAPEHYEVPYAFKIYAIAEAIELCYTSILWLDSSVFAIKDITPIFEEIERDGFIFQEAGHMLGNWTNDRSLEYFDITRDEAMGVRMIGNAGFLGLDLTQERPQEFFALWQQAMLDGMFKGEWNNDTGSESADPRVKGFRHDMSCSSAIVFNMGLGSLMKRGDEWLQYAAPEDVVLNETIILKAQGL